MAMGSVTAGVVTFRQAEDALLTARELRGRIPERGRFRLGSGCSWPQVVRRREDGDYPDTDVRPRGFVTSVEVSELERFEALTEDAVGVGDLALVKRVVRFRLSEGGSEVSWPVILRGELANEQRLRGWATSPDVFAFHDRRVRAMTSDGLRMRYGRALTRLAKAMTKAGMVVVRSGDEGAAEGVAA